MKPFSPLDLPLPATVLRLPELFRLAGRANQLLGRFDGCLEGVINKAVLVSPLATREAVLSARIEGTITTMGEVLRYQAEGVEEREQVDEIREIVNYRRALLAATESLEHRALSLQLIRQAHEILLDSVRGKDEMPGQIRDVQNYVGAFGTPIEGASYVPPAPMFLNDHLENFDQYLAYKEEDEIVQAAIIHAQFELIHPFRDGNGRLGRMLIPLFLHSRRILAYPSFYLSEYFEKHHSEYIERLQAISRDGDWHGWVRFFLEAVVGQADSNTEKARGVHQLYARMKLELDKSRSIYSMRVLDGLFYLCAFTSRQLMDYAGISRDIAMRFIRRLRAHGTLKPIQEKSGSRPAILAFAELVNLVEGRDVI